MAMQLLTKKKAFSCFCGDDKLKELKQKAKDEKKSFKYDDFCSTLSDEVVLEVNAPFTVRIQKPEHNIKFTDLLKGDFDYKYFDIDSFVILKHDKTPTYNYACAVDDMLMDISTVIREESPIENTPMQIHVRESLGYTKEISYIHLPIILDVNNTKKNDTNSIKFLISEGFLPSAIANYLVLLGNNTPTEIFTLEEAVSWFDIENISKNPTKFEMSKLRLINKKHLEMMDEMRLSKILGFADIDIGKLGKLYLEELCTINELKLKIDTIFAPKTSGEGFNEELKILKNCLQNASFYDDFDELKKYITQTTGLKDKNLSKPLMYILTGTVDGPNISDIYPFIKNYLGEIIK
jgi:glutamyl-tRNA synthetase